MTYRDLRDAAARLRALPLEEVLLRLGAERDRRDPAKWRTREGILSVTGMRFMDWRVGRGGGGAIDLVMHVYGLGFTAAVQWLGEQIPGPVSRAETPRRATSRDLRLPPADRRQLARVRRYLVEERALPAALLDPLLATGAVYADARANAVFLLRAEDGRAVGAELRGTTALRWRGLAPGSRKDLGWFSAGEWACRGRGVGGMGEGRVAGGGATEGRSGDGGYRGGGATVVLCESAIDAISHLALDPDRVCLSTSGARAHPGWLASLLDRGHAVWCGFDADATGDEMAAGMIARFPAVKRLRPPQHDWNDVLVARG